MPLARVKKICGAAGSKDVDIAAWLMGLGLEQYEPAFRANEIDENVLPSLTAEDLTELGVNLVGHRRRLLDAIAARRTAATVVQDELRTQPDAERRQLTIMFCDLVGSTRLAERLDPEDLREVIGAYHRAVAQVVARFEGFVAKYMGDGVLVYFGYPRAHEDDAERAVRTGLGAIAAVDGLEVKSVKLQVRIGIATGLVVVGDLIGEGSAQEQLVVGEAPNIAARLQSLAEPNSVLIAASTRRLVGDLFEYRDLGAVAIKGITEPVQTSHVLWPSVTASRFEAMHGSALNRLIGRDREIELLLRLWARVIRGDGQVVLISGEAGLGKSRISAALEQRLRAEPHLRLRYFCSPYYQDSALYPVIDQLGRASGFTREDTRAAKLDKLEAVLTRAGAPSEDVALLADLLSLPLSERHWLPNLSPQRKKERTLDALIGQLEGLARKQPVVIVFEDAHWIDPTSRELLGLAIERLRSLPALLVVTFRPEFQPPWLGQPQVSMLALNRLDRQDRIAMIASIADKPLPGEVVEQIVDRADGVPLFIEELTKNILESGLLREEADRYVLDRPLPPFAVPTSLHDSLMGRLDRLVSVRFVAQVGAAIGREFSYTLLHAVCCLSESELRTTLARLVDADLVFQRGAPPDAVYTFKHALVQDAAHGSLLRRSRQHLHAQIADALLAQSPELTETEPDLFAQHYAEAGLIEKSIAFWHRSAARSNLAEAAVQFRKGIDLLELQPSSPECLRQKLELWSALGAVLHALRGYAAPETGDAFLGAWKLWEQLGSPSEYMQVPFGQIRYHVHHGELALAQSLDEDLLRLARQRNDGADLALAHYSSGRTLMFAGGFTAARSHLEAALALHDPVAARARAHQLGFFHHPHAHGFLGIVLFALGYPEQGLAQSNAGIEEAEQLNDPHTFAGNLLLGAGLALLLGDDGALCKRNEQLDALAIEQGFTLYRAQATINRGWAKLKSGDVPQGTSLLRRGLADYRATGAQAWVPFYLALLARACEMGSQVDEATRLLEDALQLADQNGERWFAAELNRHRGQLLERQGNAEAAEACYNCALTLAATQRARVWELRAAASLARLRRDPRLLTPIYDWFAEGFDTPDLTREGALVQELGANHGT